MAGRWWICATAPQPTTARRTLEVFGFVMGERSESEPQERRRMLQDFPESSRAFSRIAAASSPGVPTSR